MRREIKQQKKLQRARSIEFQKNDLVKKWLTTTPQPAISNTKLNATAVSSTESIIKTYQRVERRGVIGAGGNSQTKCTNSSRRSSVSEVSFNPRYKALSNSIFSNSFLQDNKITASKVTNMQRVTSKIAKLCKKVFHLSPTHDRDHDQESDHDRDSVQTEGSDYKYMNNANSNNQQSQYSQQDELQTNSIDEHTEQWLNRETEEHAERNDKISAKENKVYPDLGITEEYRKRLKDQDMTVMYNMFELLITKMSVVQQQMTGVKESQTALNTKVTELEHSIEFLGQSVDEVSEELDDILTMNVKIIQATIKSEENCLSVKSQ